MRSRPGTRTHGQARMRTHYAVPARNVPPSNRKPPSYAHTRNCLRALLIRELTPMYIIHEPNKIRARFHACVVLAYDHRRPEMFDTLLSLIRTALAMCAPAFRYINTTFTQGGLYIFFHEPNLIVISLLTFLNFVLFCCFYFIYIQIQITNLTEEM